MSDAPPDDSLPSADAVFPPRPPLWQPSAPKPSSRGDIVMAAVLGGVVAVMAFLFFELRFFATPATAMPVTVVAVESASPADESHPGRFTCRVRLPDGTSARFTSESVHPEGTRLLAMVSRGRLTGRALVAPPYSVLPGE